VILFPKTGAGHTIADVFQYKGGSGPGGRDELVGLLNNPMVRRMTWQLVETIGLEALVQNPAIVRVFQRLWANGGLERLMLDPSPEAMVGYFSLR